MATEHSIKYIELDSFMGKYVSAMVPITVPNEEPLDAMETRVPRIPGTDISPT